MYKQGHFTQGNPSRFHGIQKYRMERGPTFEIQRRGLDLRSCRRVKRVSLYRRDVRLTIHPLSEIRRSGRRKLHFKGTLVRSHLG